MKFGPKGGRINEVSLYMYIYIYIYIYYHPPVVVRKDSDGQGRGAETIEETEETGECCGLVKMLYL